MSCRYCTSLSVLLTARTTRRFRLIRLPFTKAKSRKDHALSFFVPFNNHMC